MSELTKTLLKTKSASHDLALLSEKKINLVLHAVAAALVRATPAILAANQKDLARMEKSSPLYARLELTEKKIKNIAADMLQVARLKTPLHQTLEKRTLRSGLKLEKITVPLGVIGIIYESRPNVTADIFALCFKSGSACVLKGGSDAKYSSAAIVSVIQGILRQQKINPNIVHLIAGGRSKAEQLMRANGLIDVLIVRGSAKLIAYVRDHATVPFIETGAGVVHTFVDASADVLQAARIIDNAKTSRPAVCNALDTLLVHQSQLKNLPELVKLLSKKNVALFADATSFNALKNKYPNTLLHRATAKNFGMEFLSLKLAIKIVKTLGDAMKHIARYGSAHSEAILSRNKKNIERFLSVVDAAAVYANTATTFTDGAEFGLGAEIGISTQKLHARGPMGLRELVSYKWVVRGKGQIRK